MIRTHRRLRGAVVALVAVASLSACGQMQAGAAAVIGGDPDASVGADRRIAVSDVQTATAQLQSVYGREGGVTQEVVLSQLILAPYVLAAGSRIGGGVSDEDARQTLRTVAQQIASENGATPTYITPDAETLEVLRSVITLNQVQGGQLQPAQVQQFFEAVQAAVRTDGVDVNPRYGQFQLDTLSVTATSPDWIKSTAQPTAPDQGTAPQQQEPPTQVGQEPAPEVTP